jgi:hypothetical protein
LLRAKELFVAAMAVGSAQHPATAVRSPPVAFRGRQPPRAGPGNLDRTIGGVSA